MFFNGFCLKNEKELFNEYLIQNDFTISGFSYGAQKAFEYTLNTKKRVDLLQLFSPAFFQDKDKKYKRLQLMFFKKDANEYANNFLKNCGFSKKVAEQYFELEAYEELEALLNYIWDKKKLEILINRGTKIEVYLGKKDKIIDSEIAKEFFKDYAEVYYIKEKGHILQ